MFSRDTGVAAIESLMERRGAFDYILLETTGLADPGNIAPMFWLDDSLGSSIYLDGVVTLVDAKNILHSLDEDPSAQEPSTQPASNLSTSVLSRQESDPVDEGDLHEGTHLTTAHLQISHADVIVINKSDLVTAAELEVVTARIRGINGLARLHTTSKSEVPVLEGMLLDLHAYEGVEDVEMFKEKGHSHLDKVSTINTSRLVIFLPLLYSIVDRTLRQSLQ